MLHIEPENKMLVHIQQVQTNPKGYQKPNRIVTIVSENANNCSWLHKFVRLTGDREFISFNYLGEASCLVVNFCGCFIINEKT